MNVKSWAKDPSIPPEETVPERLRPTPEGNLDRILLSLTQFDARLLVTWNLFLGENPNIPKLAPKHVMLEDPDEGEFVEIVEDNRATLKENALEKNELDCWPWETVIPLLLPAPGRTLTDTDESDIHTAATVEDRDASVTR